MITENPFKGINYQLRSVNSGDSYEVLRLRLDSSLNSYIHETSPEKHESWLEEQLVRPNDYYFAIESLEDFSIHGFIGIYEICESRGEWGRWILNPGSPASIESYWLILKFGFELGLSEIYSRTDLRNMKVISMHDSFQFSKTEVIGIDQNEYKVHTLDRKDWPGFERHIKKYIRRRVK